MSPLWRAWLTVPEARAAAAERVFEGWAEAVSVFELASADRRSGGPSGNAGRGSDWASEIWLAEVCVVEGIATTPPDAAELACRAAGEGLPTPGMAPLAAHDWAAGSHKGLAVRRIGRIVVGDPGTALPPAPARLYIAATNAFGTGAHPTTAGCLAALNRRRTRPRPRAVLDLGAGSGVLAVAAARLWPGICVVASDIDPATAAPFARNARANGLRLRLVLADGVGHAALRARAPYDVILANLLYRPLMRLAPEIARRAAPGGLVVLSGILQRQEYPLRLALRRHGLRFRRAQRRDGWSTVEVERPRGRYPGPRGSCRHPPFRL
ncbi:MAG: 50S ribosomal protein L11 methyltransferase [Alphaproteobacteria bacterium]|nr:50S ribosomal protein L11 methyltransferase [Alphaproteobacteria bacterium]